MSFSTVRVVAPARLHFGFLDLNFGLERRFGGLGLAIDRPAIRLTLRRDSGVKIGGPDKERAADILKRLDAQDVSLTIYEAIPSHSGLGSGTQLALAIGAAWDRLRGEAVDPADSASRLGRGGRSSIGLGAFISGGLLLDGGRGLENKPPPVLSRIAFPEDWRILLIFDRAAAGLSGAAETGAFRDAAPMPEEAAGRLCRLALMKALPGAAEGDLEAFGSAVAEMQRILGDHFAPMQGGRFASAKVAAALEALASEGAHVGQTSWGPTGYAFFASQAEAERAARKIPNADLMICRGRNHGADISADSL